MDALRILLKTTTLDTGVLYISLVCIRKKLRKGNILRFTDLCSYGRFLNILCAYPLDNDKIWWNCRYWAFSSRKAFDLILKESII